MDPLTPVDAHEEAVTSSLKEIYFYSSPLYPCVEWNIHGHS